MPQNYFLSCPSFWILWSIEFETVMKSQIAQRCKKKKQEPMWIHIFAPFSYPLSTLLCGHKIWNVVKIWKLSNFLRLSSCIFVFMHLLLLSDLMWKKSLVIPSHQKKKMHTSSANKCFHLIEVIEINAIKLGHRIRYGGQKTRDRKFTRHFKGLHYYFLKSNSTFIFHYI